MSTVFTPILNYSNEVVTYPMYTEYSSITIISRTFNNIITVSATRSQFRNIKSGQWLFLDTGGSDSQLLKIIGINRAEFKLVTDRNITVQPTDSVLRVIDFGVIQNICVYNNGLVDVYVNNQEIVPGEKIYYTDKTINQPIVVYGSGSFQIAIGNINTLADAIVFPANALLSAEGFGNDTETFVIPALINVPQSKLRTITVGNTNYVIGQEIDTYDDLTGTFVCYPGLIVSSTTPIFIDYIQ